jgi:cellulose synthase/poly-beta-1,6-N-acetylglucosamine synthase-like glycosyltransferase
MVQDKGNGEERPLFPWQDRSKKPRDRMTSPLKQTRRKFLAPEGPSLRSVSPAPVAHTPVGPSSSRVGTLYWHWERGVHQFITRYEAGVQRFLDALPGLLAWITILLPLFLARDAPALAVMITIIFQVYWLYRGIGLLVYGTVGYTRIRSQAEVDWRELYAREQATLTQRALSWENIRHIVVIPNYREPIEKLRQSLEALARQKDAASQIWVVLAMEEKEEGAVAKARALQREFRGRLGGVFYTLHPANLPGEIAGKSSNEAWAARWARKHFVDRLGHNIRHITITSCDADSRFHPHYFACLTYKFTTDPGRHHRFWQAPILFYNNVWQVPTFIRFVAMMIGMLQLAGLANPYEDSFPNSTYSASLYLVDSVDYWDPDVISEDWHMFIKCFFQSRGRVTVEPIYLPVSGDAPLSSTLWRTATNRYEQAKRHAWGASDVSYAFKLYFKHAEIPTRLKFPLVWNLARDHYIWATSWFILVLGVTVPNLYNPGFAFSMPGQVLLKLYAMFAILSAFLSPVTYLIDLGLRPPRPAERKWWQRVWSGLQWSLLPIYLLFFVTIPSVEAQTRLMMGERLDYRVTEKI